MAEAKDWSDLAINLYDRLTGRGAEITYEFENMEIQIPESTDSNANHAKWLFNGLLKIRTREVSQK